MAEYIDKDKLKQELKDYYCIFPAMVKRAIENAPVEDVVDIETLKKWLYKIAFNNVGCKLEGDFSDACEEIISRLDGLKRFVQETRGQGDGENISI